jgi:hypothetical protein
LSLIARLLVVTSDGPRPGLRHGCALDGIASVSLAEQIDRPIRSAPPVRSLADPQLLGPRAGHEATRRNTEQADARAV